MFWSRLWFRFGFGFEFGRRKILSRGGSKGGKVKRKINREIGQIVITEKADDDRLTKRRALLLKAKCVNYCYFRSKMSSHHISY